MYQHILVPLDGSQPSLQALSHAIDIGSGCGATLTLLSITNADAVLDRFDLFEDMTDTKVKDLAKIAKDQSTMVLEKAKALVPPTLACETKQIVSTPEIGILREADEIKADLICMGRRGKHSLSEKLLGSASTYVLSRAKCPVLLARDEKKQSYQQILVPVDGSEQSLKALAQAIEIAKADQASLLILHVANLRDLLVEETALDMKKEGLEDLTDRLRQSAHRAFEKCRAHVPSGMKVKYIAQIGRPGATIIKEAEKHQADLIVMGSHGRNGLETLVLGSVSRYVISHSGLAILITR